MRKRPEESVSANPAIIELDAVGVAPSGASIAATRTPAAAPPSGIRTCPAIDPGVRDAGAPCASMKNKSSKVTESSCNLRSQGYSFSNPIC
jgi:hypothetical protein